jgi:hypothetical protein
MIDDKSVWMWWWPILMQYGWAWWYIKVNLTYLAILVQSIKQHFTHSVEAWHCCKI